MEDLATILESLSSLVHQPSAQSRQDMIKGATQIVHQSQLINKTEIITVITKCLLADDGDLHDPEKLLRNVTSAVQRVHIKKSTSLSLGSQIHINPMGGIFMKIKLFVGFAQCLSYFPVTFDMIPWPTNLLSTMKFLELFSLDIVSILGDASCGLQMPFLSKFVAHMMLVPTLLLLLVLGYAITQRYMTPSSTKFTFESVKTTFYTLVSVTQYTLYIGVATRICRLFKCREIMGMWYLTADYTVVCFESAWNSAAVLGYVCMVLYVIGIPLAQFAVLFRHRKHIDEKVCVSDEDYRQHLAIKAMYGSIFEAYIPSCYYYDLVDLVRRLVLTGGLILIGSQEAVAQIFSGMLLSALWLVLVLYSRPYVTWVDTMLSAVLSFTLMLTLFTGVCMRLYELTEEGADEYQRNAFGVMLIVAIVLCMVLSLVAVVMSMECMHGVVKRWVASCRKDVAEKNRSEGEVEVSGGDSDISSAGLEDGMLSEKVSEDASEEDKSKDESETVSIKVVPREATALVQRVKMNQNQKQKQKKLMVSLRVLPVMVSPPQQQISQPTQAAAIVPILTFEMLLNKVGTTLWLLKLVKAKPDSLFEKLDTNQSGGLSPREFQKLLLLVDRRATSKEILVKCWRMAMNGDMTGKREMSVDELVLWIQKCADEGGAASEVSEELDTLGAHR